MLSLSQPPRRRPKIMLLLWHRATCNHLIVGVFRTCALVVFVCVVSRERESLTARHFQFQQDFRQSVVDSIIVPVPEIGSYSLVGCRLQQKQWIIHTDHNFSGVAIDIQCLCNRFRYTNQMKSLFKHCSALRV